MESWREVEPRPVWILRRGVTPLPAWPGILIAWKKIEGNAVGIGAWMGLVSFVRRRGAFPELEWFAAGDIRKMTEEAPICSSDSYPKGGPWSLP